MRDTSRLRQSHKKSRRGCRGLCATEPLFSFGLPCLSPPVAIPKACQSREKRQRSRHLANTMVTKNASSAIQSAMRYTQHVVAAPSPTDVVPFSISIPSIACLRNARYQQQVRRRRMRYSLLLPSSRSKPPEPDQRPAAAAKLTAMATLKLVVVVVGKCILT